MPLSVGVRLGPYEILAPIGRGGMGEVYKACDTRLDRTVAIKILPAEFAADPQFRERFDREAHAIAALNHPHICALHDVGEAASPNHHAAAIRFLVMEYVDGETLAQRLETGALPIEQVLHFAIEIADALDKAHRAGIVHRDLKPGNIMLTKSGVKLLDFGLAKRHVGIGADVGASAVPTAAPITTHGAILGTLQYMAPEQLEGKDADERTDIFAFGAVVYEMATGKRAFEGKSQMSLIAAILEHDPLPIATVQPLSPPSLDHIVRTCLAKDPDARWQSASDLARELNWIEHELPVRAGGDERRLRARTAQSIVPAIASAALAAAIGVAAGRWMYGSPQPSASIVRTLVAVSPADQLLASDQTNNYGRPGRTAIAVAPDGNSIVFSAWRGGHQQLYVRRLDELEATPLTATDSAINPFFSPDGQWVGYWARGELRKVPTMGGPSVTIGALAVAPFGASWGSDDRIVLGRGDDGLWQVPAAGGSPARLTMLDERDGEVSHRLPHAIRGTDLILFTVTRNRFPKWDQTRVFVYSRRTGSRTLLIEGGADARYAATGHLLFAREGVIMAAPFDRASARLTGGAVGVVPDVMQAAYHFGSDANSGAAQFSVSDIGVLGYIPGGVMPAIGRQLVWVDRDGRTEPLPVPVAPFNQPRLSPDGGRIAVYMQQKNQDVWIFDVKRRTLTRLTTEGQNATPVWTPDGAAIVYRSSSVGPDNLFIRSSDGTGTATRLTSSRLNEVPAAISADGRTLAFYGIGGGPIGIWSLAFSGDRTPRPLMQTKFSVGGFEFSRDGRWIAYASNESGRFEVYVQPLDDSGHRQQISVDGGMSPVWSHDGRELFFIQPGVPVVSAGAPNDLIAGTGMAAISVMAAPIDRTGGQVGSPRRLFDGDFAVNYPARTYDVTADGRRFLMLQQKTRPPTDVRHIVLVQNWFEQLKRQVDKGVGR